MRALFVFPFLLLPSVVWAQDVAPPCNSDGVCDAQETCTSCEHDCGPCEAQAQDPFDEGVEALRQHQFTRARDLFRRSLIAAPHPATVFNLARALRGTGQTTSSVALFDALLAGDYGELEGEQLVQVQRLRAETFAELATIQIVLGGAASGQIHIDGEPHGTVSQEAAFEERVDAGTRLVTVSAPGFVDQERVVVLELGATVSLEIELEPAPPSGEPQGPVERPTPIVRRPWFWITLGVAAAAVGVGIWLAVDRPWEEEIQPHPVYGIIYTLRGR